MEELLTKLSGAEKFTKIDLLHAYHQLELTPECRKYTTIPIKRTIENVLKDLPRCCALIDNILVSKETDEILLNNLYCVLQRLQECGLRLNPDKFSFMLGKTE